MSSFDSTYSKWNKIDYGEEDEQERMAKQLMLQGPFIHEIKWYFDNAPCPNLLHAHYWQMKDAGWSQECIDYKLKQLVHYSKDTIMYKTLENERVKQELKKEQDNVQTMMKIKEKIINDGEEAIQQAQLLEQHLFPSHMKRSRQTEIEKDNLLREPSIVDFERKMDSDFA